MKKTLYLTQKANRSNRSRSLFLPAKSQGDVVLLEESGGRMFPYTREERSSLLTMCES